MCTGTDRWQKTSLRARAVLQSVLWSESVERIVGLPAGVAKSRKDSAAGHTVTAEMSPDLSIATLDIRWMVSGRKLIVETRGSWGRQVSQLVPTNAGARVWWSSID